MASKCSDKCSVFNHPQAAEINRLLALKQVSRNSIAVQFGLVETSLRRHEKNHLDEKTPETASVERSVEASSDASSEASKRRSVETSEDVKLNPLEARFVEQIVHPETKTNTSAAINAGYSPRGAATAAYKNLQKPHVQSAIRERVTARAEFFDEQLDLHFERLNKLMRAVDAWLSDPDDESRYMIEPRCDELEVVYLDYSDCSGKDFEPKRKKSSLRELLKRAEAGNVRPLAVALKTEDARKLMLETADKLMKQLELLAKLKGAFVKEKDNPETVERQRQALEKVVQSIMLREGKSRDKALERVVQLKPEVADWLN